MPLDQAAVVGVNNSKGFRQLLERDSGNADIQKELDAVLKNKTSGNGLVGLFSEWVDLIKQVKSLQ